MAKRKFRRIVLKLSGEALAGEQGFGINPDVVEEFAKEIAALAKSTDLEIAIVVGGGNLWRGLAGSNQGMDRSPSTPKAVPALALARCISGNTADSSLRLKKAACTLNIKVQAAFLFFR